MAIIIKGSDLYVERLKIEDIVEDAKKGAEVVTINYLDKVV